MEKHIHAIFPTSSIQDINSWSTYLIENEFETLLDLKGLEIDVWNKMNLPEYVKDKLKEFVSQLNEESLFGMNPLSNFKKEDTPISQINCVVIDISGSMKSKSSLDRDKTREDVSKILFHTLVDKLISLELSHTMGLIAFGEKVTPVDITREYEHFHTELGRLDANEGSTKLYDAIVSASEVIETFAASNQTMLADGCKKRIFVLTDGEDNASVWRPWQVAKALQDKSIVLDAIPLAGNESNLQGMCVATNGLCFHVESEEQAIRLFEREAVLHVAYREVVDVSKPINDQNDFDTIFKENAISKVTDVKCAVAPAVYAPCMSAAAAVAKANSMMQTDQSITTTSSHNGRLLKRVYREYLDISNNPINGWVVFMRDDDPTSWKVVLSDLDGHYSNGRWLLTVNFSSEYPFRAPKVRFVTPIYHTNINNDGHICMSLLSDEWNPALKVSDILQGIVYLLQNPDYQNPLDAYKGQLYRDNIESYRAEAKHHTSVEASHSYDELTAKYNLV
jgi:ubiquitin-conjugating enzyme E2 D/E